MKKSSSKIREQVGQLMIVGFEGPEADKKVLHQLNRVQPGGIILFARNITSAPQTYDLLQQCSRVVRAPLFKCVDLEGGTVDRFREVIGPAPSQHEVASRGSKRLSRKHGELLGNEARALGFNTDFAPVSDLGFARSHNVLGSRTVSSSTAETITHVREFMKGLEAAGVLGCGKHFPGLGEADLDTHHLLPSIDKDWKDLWREDLMPYRKLHKIFPFVMVAHAAYPAVTKDNTPASLSEVWMRQVLRKKIGYKGLVLSDDLEMGGVLAAASIEDAAIETLEAGADMFLVCRKEVFVDATFEAVVKRAEKDASFARIVEKASARVLRFKKTSRAFKRKTARPTESVIQDLRGALEGFKAELAKAAPRS